jgi:hypothetical protein
MDNFEQCGTCVFWERRSSGWGRCWLAEDEGDRYTRVHGMLETYEDYGCIAYEEKEDDD